MRLPFKEISIHIVIWSVFIAYEITVVRGMGSQASWLNYLCFYPLDIAVFYFNAHLASPLAARQPKPVLWLAVAWIAELILFNILCCGMDIFVNTVQKGQLTVEIDATDLIGNTWRGIYILGLSTGYFLGLRSLVNAKKANEMAELRMKGELRAAALENAHLRAQINPHFLFNTLNFIYSSVRNVAPSVAESIGLLADSMQYAMQQPREDGLIELSMEIGQMERFIELNQLRSNHKFRVDMQVSPLCYNDDLRIPPLLLLTFLENMFKHGNLVDEPACIELSYTDRVFHFYARNLKANTRIVEVENIGLANIRSRLNQYYPDRHDLYMEHTETHFILDLKLNL